VLQLPSLPLALSYSSWLATHYPALLRPFPVLTALVHLLLSFPRTFSILLPRFRHWLRGFSCDTPSSATFSAPSAQSLPSRNSLVCFAFFCLFGVPVSTTTSSQLAPWPRLQLFPTSQPPSTVCMQFILATSSSPCYLTPSALPPILTRSTPLSWTQGRDMRYVWTSVPTASRGRLPCQATLSRWLYALTRLSSSISTCQSTKSLLGEGVSASFLPQVRRLVSLL
jgi:hypothetical protein